MARLRWNRKRLACVNCGSDSYDRRPRGYCAKCFPDAERLRKMARWDASDSRTWIGSPFRGAWLKFGMSGQEYIGRCQDILQKRLEHRQVAERIRAGEEQIDGLALEHLLNELAVMAGCRTRQLFYGWATMLDHTFPVEQRRVIFTIIDKIKCHTPPRSMWVRPLHDYISKKINDNARREYLRSR